MVRKEAARVAAAGGPALEGLISPLTAQSDGIIRLSLLDGYSDKEIADRLTPSRLCLSDYRRHITRKLGSSPSGNIPRAVGRRHAACASTR